MRLVDATITYWPNGTLYSPGSALGDPRVQVAWQYIQSVAERWLVATARGIDRTAVRAGGDGSLPGIAPRHRPKAAARETATRFAPAEKADLVREDVGELERRHDALVDSVVAYTDGGCAPNPGPGAWAYRLEWPDGRVQEAAAAELHTTNNREELKAVREALIAIRDRIGDKTSWRIVIRTDSSDVIGWLTRTIKRKANLDLYPTIDPLIDGRTQFEFVRGHAGEPGNERVDTLVGQARETLRSGRPSP